MYAKELRADDYQSGGGRSSRTEKTICLAVLPALKSFGIPSRPRFFEVIQTVNRVNAQHKNHMPGRTLFLAKVAMDIIAKYIPADKDGVRIAELDEMGILCQLWNHRPLTDFWRVGKGYAGKLEEHQMFTIDDVARCSVDNEDFLY